MKSIYVLGETLPECWEKSVIKCWEEGENFPTQYDKAGDPNSRDVMAMIHIKNPMSEPRIHRAFPGGLDDLEKYRSEVLYGVHDHWVNPAEGKWEYTYHQRLFEYDVAIPDIPKPEQNPEFPLPPYYSISKINQIEKCIEMLKQCGFTRRAQAVTWKAWEDLGIRDPACLQRVWFRVESYPCGPICGLINEMDGYCKKCNNTGSRQKLNMTVHMRSNDAYKAAFMNMYAFIELQSYVAEQVGIDVGEYIHVADSFHIYGSYFKEFEGFLKTVKNREFKDRVWTSEYAREFFVDGCDTLLSEADMPEDKKNIVLKRKEYLIGEKNDKV